MIDTGHGGEPDRASSQAARHPGRAEAGDRHQHSHRPNTEPEVPRTGRAGWGGAGLRAARQLDMGHRGVALSVGGGAAAGGVGGFLLVIS